MLNKTLVTQNKNCSSISQIPIQIITVPGCNEFYVKNNNQNPNILEAMFKVNPDSCVLSKTIWPVIVGVVGGVFLIVILLVLVFGLNPKAKDCIRLYKKRVNIENENRRQAETQFKIDMARMQTNKSNEIPQ